ncbi:hypothetical protein [Streptomyces uncialis]|uniref:hypothetical protein n=1 Tax=Streptomyces uncialis TaxID=1048205 RepID=UPI0033D61C49
MPSLKRPELPEGPLRALNRALHDLHERAGIPSVRDLEHRLGGSRVVSRSRIYDAFTSRRLPSWGLLQLLTEELTKTIPRSDPVREEVKLHTLWLAASGHDAQGRPKAEPQLEEALTSFSPYSARILVIRAEWAEPAWVDTASRRRLRAYVTKALEDVGYGPEEALRIDRSAGSTVALDAERESPSLTAATFLAALDHELRTMFAFEDPPELRFMAHQGIARFDGSDGSVVEDDGGLAELEAYWTKQEVLEMWPSPGPRERPVSAIVCGSLYQERHFAVLSTWKVVPSQQLQQTFWVREPSFE